LIGHLRWLTVIASEMNRSQSRLRGEFDSGLYRLAATAGSLEQPQESTTPLQRLSKY
jgi:hypothetical protein